MSTFIQPLFQPAENATDFSRSFSYIRLKFERELNTVRCCLLPNAPRHFTWPLLEELLDAQNLIAAWIDKCGEKAPMFHVFESGIPSVFSYGGDMKLFLKLVRQRNKTLLRDYAQSCVALVRNVATGWEGRGVPSIALVRGAALGGGFETALAARYIVAEKSATFGFPELVFGMFPGMGALQLLSLRLPHVKALRIIESARTYTAEQAFDLGLVDRLVSDGEGHKCVDEIVRRGLRQGEGHRALQRVGFEAQGEALQSLSRVADEWVGTALTLPDTQLSIMERISEAQLASEPRLTIATTTIRA